MHALDWVGMIILVGAFAAVTESVIRRAEEKALKKLERLQDQVGAICVRLGIDPVNPLDDL